MRKVFIFAQEFGDYPEGEFGWFHIWADLSEHPFALIELDDGSIETFAHHQFRFVNLPNNEE